MKLSTKGRYAMVALADLALQEEGTLLSLTDLSKRQNISLPYLEQLFVKLRRAGLVSERRAGRFAHYRANPEGLRPLVEWIDHFRSFWPERIRRLEGLLQEMDE